MPFTRLASKMSHAKRTGSSIMYYKDELIAWALKY